MQQLMEYNNNMMKQIVNFSKNIGKWHSKLFVKLSEKAGKHWVWGLALTFVALYEIFEHIALPLIAILWGTGSLGLK